MKIYVSAAVCSLAESLNPTLMIMMMIMMISLLDQSISEDHVSDVDQ